MDNIINYVENNMKTFAEKSFGVVDSVVLSKLSYLRMEGLVPHLRGRGRPVKLVELLKAESFGHMFEDKREREDNQRLLFAAAASPRFRNTRVGLYTSKYDPVAEKQFSAVTFLLDDKTAYIAYRGTDSSFVGWKEDFNMAYLSPVPAQEDGVKYLNAVGRKLIGKALRVGGHSKGGNLAVYSAVKCSPRVQKRIKNVYNHDGPGFKEDLFETPGFLRIKDRAITTLPEASVFGMLLQYHENYLVVKSSARGLGQHEPFTWHIENGDFCYADKIKSGALQRSRSLNEWLGSLGDDKRKLIIDALFDILDKTDTDTFIELAESWPKSAASMLSAIKNSDPETRKFLSKTFGELAKLSLKNIFKPNRDTKDSDLPV